MENLKNNQRKWGNKILEFPHFYLLNLGKGGIKNYFIEIIDGFTRINQVEGDAKLFTLKSYAENQRKVLSGKWIVMQTHGVISI